MNINKNLTSIGNAVYTENYEYYLESGMLKQITDKNNNVTELMYDKLNRVTENKKTGLNITTAIEYNDSARRVITRKKHSATELIYSEKQYNGLGQLIEERAIDRNSTRELKRQYEYNQTGTLKRQITNPDGVEDEKMILHYATF